MEMAALNLYLSHAPKHWPSKIGLGSLVSLVAMIRVKCYNTLYHSKRKTLLINQWGCPWQGFLAQSHVGGKGWSLPKMWYLIPLNMLRYYPQPLDQAGKACRGQTYQLWSQTLPQMGAPELYFTLQLLPNIKTVACTINVLQQLIYDHKLHFRLEQTYNCN